VAHINTNRLLGIEEIDLECKKNICLGIARVYQGLKHNLQDEAAIGVITHFSNHIISGLYPELTVQQFKINQPYYDFLFENLSLWEDQEFLLVVKKILMRSIEINIELSESNYRLAPQYLVWNYSWNSSPINPSPMVGVNQLYKEFLKTKPANVWNNLSD
jgi:hypothetical protein